MLKKIATHWVASRSQKDLVHKIEVWNDGLMTCTCLGYAYRRRCAHILYIKNKYYS